LPTSTAIPARNHDAVGRFEDLLQQGYRLGALDLGDDLRLHAVFLAGDRRELAGHLDVGAVLHERHRDVVRTALHGGFNVAHVLAGQRRRRKPSALLVDALVVRELSTHPYGRVNLAADDAHDVEHDETVVQQQRVAGPDVLRQVVVVETDAPLVALLGVRVEDEGCSGPQSHAAVFELADTDLRALQIGHDRDVASDARGRLADMDRALQVILGRPVREVEAHDVDTGGQHPFQHQRVARRGAERCDDLRASGHGVTVHSAETARARHRKLSVRSGCRRDR